MGGWILERSADRGTHLEDRKQQGDRDQADHRTEDQDRRRLEDHPDPFDRDFEILVRGVCDPLQHVGESTGTFSGRHHGAD